MDLDYEVYVKWPLLSKYSAITTRFDDEMKKHGKWLSRRKRNNGWGLYSEPVVVEKQVTFVHSKVEGVYKEWSNGKLIKKYNFINGMIEGELEHYSVDNGRLCMRCHYVNNNKEGVCKYWHSNGILNEESYYKEGRQEGDYKTWNKNGKLILQCKYVKDKRDGEFKKWNEEGVLIAHGNYLNGKKNGEYKEWYNNGQLQRLCYYSNDRLKGMFTT
eukprot:CAMPEP_0168524066 /NCGR_PEP_ID=MMETSP0405-20121227/10410_1 /TAXON_ID=498012 /ORGANISM="Trichosphaerium sp, Strain Am-I-7 wt" /LENGTH=214 /DNA_ID=CAMNT_0008546165 /DNA_START=83 /DNA_END=724 /DNA_ORIENTATION=-